MPNSPSDTESLNRAWMALFFVSGALGLGYQSVWMRRLSLILGGSALSTAVVVSTFMAGLALGAWWVQWQRPRGSAVRLYAGLEALAALWALAFPHLLEWLGPASLGWTGGRTALAIALLVPPTTLLGATWPLLARAAGPSVAAGLYAANTAGAVVGVLATTFALLPNLGITQSEWALAALGLALAAGASRLPGGPECRESPAGREVPAASILFASAAAGFSALGLELVWFRLAAVGLGSTVQTFGWVLATFLATVALGAALGRRYPRDPWHGLVGALAALGALALLGAATWGQLPLAVATLYRWGGPDAMQPGTALLAALAMGGAPVASGVAFSTAVRCLGDRLPEQAGYLYAANTVGSIGGAVCGGMWALPALEVQGAVTLFAGAAALAGAGVARRPWPVLPTLVLALLVPAWESKLYAVGIYLRISDFSDASHRAVRRFADEGWTLRSYDHGTTGAVAVGQSTTTGNLWMSINGKVDASTGDDMPTQVLSGTLPLLFTPDAERVLVVGLASGITAGAVLSEPRVRELTVAELEPAVVPASRLFDAYSGAPLDDPRTRLILDDARALLQQPGPRWDVIISEPSNPWITGVSSLFTEEYWTAGRERLTDSGVFCQWVQLYGLGPDEFRGLLRTFTHVFGDVWLFETIPGSDVVLIGGSSEAPIALPLQPTLDPDGVRRLGGTGWLNTDDRPRVEWEAPRWIHYETGPDNRALIEQAKRP